MNLSYIGAQYYSNLNMSAGDDLSFLFNDLVVPEAEAGAGTGAVEVGALQGMVSNLGKRGAEWMEGAAVGEPGSKRQRSPSGSRETSGGSGSNENSGEYSEQASEASVAGAGAGAGRGGGVRRLWVKERDSDWWDMVSGPGYPEEEFKRAFRMSRATFEMVCEELAAAVAKEDTMLRVAIPVRKRVAVCIWRLATGEPLRKVSKRFGLGISTCHKLVLEVCAAIRSMLMPKVVLWPEGHAASSVAARFEAASGIPGIIGAVYTTHIPIIAPKVNVASYYNRRLTERNERTCYTITVQAAVDADGAFTDICIGYPGSMSDEDVLFQSALNLQRGETGMIQAQGKWLLGGASYPLMDWMLVPYTHTNLTWAQHVFNEKAAGVLAMAKDAFMRYKARWSCLQKRSEVKVQDFPVILGACCVLHNICERSGDTLDPELSFELVDDEMFAENPMRSPAAMKVRDTIAHNLLHLGTGAGDGRPFY